MSGNRYYRVDRAASVNIVVGSKPSNRWYGAAQVLDPVIRTVKAKRGDEVHALVGGTFLVTKAGPIHEMHGYVTSSRYGGTSERVLQEWVGINASEVAAPAIRPAAYRR